MMRIYDGRESFYQWDTNQKIVGDLKVGEEVHFFSMRQSEALSVLAYNLNGAVVADVPNILLQSSCPIFVYRYVYKNTSGSTIEQYVFEVNQRPKPSDYVYTETEVLTWKTLDERLKKLESGGTGGTGGQGKDGASAYEIAVAHGFKGTEEDWLESLKGEPGEDGYTPQKGVDYYTEADKAEMVTKVIDALPKYSGEVVTE